MFISVIVTLFDAHFLIKYHVKHYILTHVEFMCINIKYKVLITIARHKNISVYSLK